MKTIKYKIIEFFIIFIVIPVSFLFEYSTTLKTLIAATGFLYVIYVLLKIEKVSMNFRRELPWKKFWLQTSIILLIIALFTIFFVWYTSPDQLFKVVLNKPKLWIAILFFYSVFSVYPQEILYRTFFFKRYKDIIKNKTLFIIINAFLFSIAHIFFKNGLVLLLTFLGGLLFANTYKKTDSILLVSIEHAIYGCWLFTVGMGTMLGFPS